MKLTCVAVLFLDILSKKPTFSVFFSHLAVATNNQQHQTRMGIPTITNS